MNPEPMEVEESPVAGKDVISIPDDVISISDEDVVSIPDAEELRRMMEGDYMPSGVVKLMSKEGMIRNTSLEESGLSEHMDVDVVFYQPHPPHPSLPSHCCSPLPSACGPHYRSPSSHSLSPSPHYHSPSSHYLSPSPCYCSPSPHYCSPLPRGHHYHPPPP